MASRVRYLSSSPISRKDLRTASDALFQKEYSNKVAWGFIDVRNEGDSMTGTFVERYETEEQVADPFGRITKYKRIQFNQAVFRLGSTVPQLEVYDSPRSIAPLLTELSGSFGFSLTFSQILIDLQDVIKILSRDTSSLALIAATLRDISLSSDVFARVTVLGSNEVGPYLKSAALGKKVLLEKVSLRGTMSTCAFRMDITSDGMIQIHSGHQDDLMKILRGAVERSAK